MQRRVPIVSNSLRRNLSKLQLALSVSSKLFTEDPVGFTAKVAEKFRMSQYPSLQRIASFLANTIKRFNHSTLDSYIDGGEFTSGLQWAEKQKRLSRREKTLVRVHHEKLHRLHHDFAVSAPLDGAGHIAHYLTNSLPHTNSGYTLRSQKVLESQRLAGLSVAPITRLGYPLVVGKVSARHTDNVDGVAYTRMLPDSFPTSLVERDNLAIRELVRFCKKENADAIQTTTDYTNAIVVSEAASILGIPWVYEVRGELESTWASRRPASAENSEFYKLAHEAETRAMLAAAHVITLSELSKQDLIGRGVPKERITVVPNAVETAQLTWAPDKRKTADLRRSLGIGDDATIVGAITSVVNYEGLETLLAATEYLSDDYAFVIVGDGNDRERLEGLPGAMNVHFVGKKAQSEVLDWYALLDVFVIPRLDLAVTRKVTPIKGLQAQALGIPIVASDLPALREVTGNVETYVTPGSAEALAKGIREVAGTTRQQGIDWARNRSWSTNSELYKSIFRG